MSINYLYDHIYHIESSQAGEISALLVAADQQRTLGEMIDSTETAERALALAKKIASPLEEEAKFSQHVGRNL